MLAGMKKKNTKPPFKVMNQPSELCGVMAYNVTLM